MSERSGFYPSNPELGIINEYEGYELGKLYKRIISNGVFATPAGTPSTDLQVLASSGLTVVMKPGEGIFLDQWYINDEDIEFTLDGESSLDRIDLIVIEANKTAAVLQTKAKVIKGTPSAVPVAPTITDSDEIKQYPIASIRITAGITTITQSSITDMRGLAPTLWITSLIKQVDTSELWNQYNSAFWEWFDEVKETLVTTTLMRKYTGYSYTTVENQSEFTVPISQYNASLDILQVHVEGRILREGVDYSKSGNTITLTTALPVVNTLVYFEIFKSVDGSDAEAYVDRLYALEQRVGNSIVTADDGSDKIVIVSDLRQELLNAGVGFHTLYIPNTITGLPLSGKNWRGYVSFTSADNGYCMIISEDGDVYYNVYNGSTWLAWKLLYRYNVKMFYSHTSGSWLNGDTYVPLSKNISDCQNGIVLHFAKYGSLDDMNFAYHLPKVRYNGNAWNGENIAIQMAYDYTASGEASVCYKKIFVYDDQLVGFAGNTLGGSNNMVLVGISEY